MNDFVEECRREWKRLGVPDLMADEMATDLEADLAEAQADGVSTAEILGESDPRRFAETWARERGLVSEPPPQKKSRKRFWVVLAVVLAVVVFFMGIAATALFATASVHVTSAGGTRVLISGFPPIKGALVPNVVGLKACHARQIVVAGGLRVRSVPRRRCGAVVIGQKPTAGQLVAPHSRLRLRLAGG